jgi:hypothetical protein
MVMDSWYSTTSNFVSSAFQKNILSSLKFYLQIGPIANMIMKNLDSEVPLINMESNNEKKQQQLSPLLY